MVTIKRIISLFSQNIFIPRATKEMNDTEGYQDVNNILMT